MCIRDRLIINEHTRFGEISVIVCSDEFLLEMNKQYLNHNYYTDIITFNYNEAGIISGDLFISIERVKDNAETYSTAWEKELLRVIFHGVLHLVGYNDKTTKEKEIMRRKEDFYLSKVDFREIEL
jgi:rRNA maturation RNase YbeY